MTAPVPSGPPVDPPWLTEAIQAAADSIPDDDGGAQWGDEHMDALAVAVRAALPILRAGIEQELRDRLAEEIRFPLRVAEPFDPSNPEREHHDHSSR